MLRGVRVIPIRDRKYNNNAMILTGGRSWHKRRVGRINRHRCGSLVRTAKTADELRTAQAVVLPLELGLSLAQTAQAIGRSVGATCTLRTRSCKVARREREAPRPKRALRNRAHVSNLRGHILEYDIVIVACLHGSSARIEIEHFP
jgi:hypothetical protein